jgi:ABC-type nickel/cobalt efflux system permease component RcnA
MQGLIRLVLAAMAVIFLSAAAMAPAIAQSTDQSAPAVVIDKKKLLVQPRNKDGTVEQVAFLEDPVLWMREKQQAFYGKMSGALRQMKSGSALAATWTLMLLSFGYGVFHAAGPGHGKAVITAWLLATEHELKRGILISFMSAIVQALTAIILVSALFLIVASVGATARNVAGYLESASYGLIGVMGLYLIWTALSSFWPRKLIAPAPALVTAGPRQPLALHSFETFQPLANKNIPADHVHGPECGCGHSHVPDARDLRGDFSFAKAFSLAFAVGIRPCTGAILVLVFANGLGLYWAGVASTFAMAVGTFITVSVIAAMAVYSKKLAMRFASQDDRWLSWLGFALRIGGGSVIAFLGTILFLGSLGTTNAMM